MSFLTKFRSALASHVMLKATNQNDFFGNDVLPEFPPNLITYENLGTIMKERIERIADQTPATICYFKKGKKRVGDY